MRRGSPAKIDSVDVTLEGTVTLEWALEEALEGALEVGE